MRALAPFLLALLLPSLTASAQLRELEDKFGRVIQAHLVSHPGVGADKIKIKKADGKEFEVEVGMFSAADQKAIREWMKTTPPTLNYAFRVEATKRKLGTRSATSYDVKVTNLARQAVRGIKVKTRSIYEYSYIPYGTSYYSYGGRLVAFEESADIPAELEFNQSAKFSTTDRYNLIGLMVRVYNAEGEVIEEEKIGSTKLTRLNWDDGRRRSSPPGTGEPDDGTGGKTRVIIED